MSEYAKTYPPKVWEELLDIQVKDPDGWRGADTLGYTIPITHREFLNRASRSTVQMGDSFAGWADPDADTSEPAAPRDETIAERACRTLREAADAYDAVPATLRTFTLFGVGVRTDILRQEAQAIEDRVQSFREATGG